MQIKKASCVTIELNAGSEVMREGRRCNTRNPKRKSNSRNEVDEVLIAMQTISMLPSSVK